MSTKYDLPTNEERLAKEFEKLGRQFFDKVDAKNFTQAYKMLDRLTYRPQQTMQETKIYYKSKKFNESRIGSQECYSLSWLPVFLGLLWLSKPRPLLGGNVPFHPANLLTNCCN